jgi:hypothetical protein
MQADLKLNYTVVTPRYRASADLLADDKTSISSQKRKRSKTRGRS